MLYRVAVIGSLLLTLASISLAQVSDASTRNIDPSSRPMNGDIMSALTGVVRTQDNRGVPNARVEVRDMTGGVIASTYSGPNGSFQINNLASGRYEVVATVGLSEGREQLMLDRGENTITLRVSEHAESAGAGNATSVSVAAMRVPEKARKALEKARGLAGKNRNDEAMKELNRALDIYPQYSDALRERGIMNYAAGHLEEAKTDLDQAIKCDPNNAMAYVALGATFNNDNKFDDALRALDRALSLAPDVWQGYFELARTKLAKGDYEGSLRAADKAQQFMKNEYAPIHLVRAHAMLGMKNYTDAQGEFEAFLARDPNGEDSARVRQTLDQVKAFTARAASGK
jgi:tetratricopeptide (TPR) repeat protein